MGSGVKGRADYWGPGDWNVACSLCGRKRKASMMVKNWQGLWRCPEHNEPRQPQDFVRATADIQTPPWVQPETDLDIQICTLEGISSIADFAIPGCAIPGAAYLGSIPQLPDDLFCTFTTSSGMPGYSIPGCMTPGKLIPP